MDWATTLGGVVTTITDGVEDMLPVLLPLLGLFVLVRLVPRLTRIFAR